MGIVVCLLPASRPVLIVGSARALQAVPALSALATCTIGAFCWWPRTRTDLQRRIATRPAGGPACTHLSRHDARCARGESEARIPARWPMNAEHRRVARRVRTPKARRQGARVEVSTTCPLRSESERESDSLFRGSKRRRGYRPAGRASPRPHSDRRLSCLG